MPDGDDVFELAFEGEYFLHLECYTGDADGDEEVFIVFHKDQFSAALYPSQLGCIRAPEKLARIST